MHSRDFPPLQPIYESNAVLANPHSSQIWDDTIEA